MSRNFTEGHYIRPGRTMVFWKLLCSIWDSKNYVMDADGIFAGIIKKTFQETLLILVHAVERGKNKEIINEGFNNYSNKLHKKKSEDKGRINQWVQRVFFALYAWNSGPVDGTYISLSVVATIR